MMTNFDNNEDKVCSLFKDGVGGLRVGSRARLHVRSHDHRSRDHSVTDTKKEKLLIK